MGQTNYNPCDQRHDHSAEFNVLSGSEGIVPVIEEFRNMTPNTEGQDDRSTEL